MSPSGTGVKIFVKASKPDVPHIRCKTSAGAAESVEIYDHKRFFALSGIRLEGTSAEIEPRQEQLNTLYARLFPEPAPRQPTSKPPGEHTYARPAAGHACTATMARDDICRRAAAYVAKMPPAISGQHGSGTTCHVCCVLVKGFGLSRTDALPILEEYNARCEPPWDDRELGADLTGQRADRARSATCCRAATIPWRTSWQALTGST